MLAMTGIDTKGSIAGFRRYISNGGSVLSTSKRQKKYIEAKNEVRVDIQTGDEGVNISHLLTSVDEEFSGLDMCEQALRYCSDMDVLLQWYACLFAYFYAYFYTYYVSCT